MMNVRHYRLGPDSVPVDFFADPDGHWTYEALLEAAGFHPEAPRAAHLAPAHSAPAHSGSADSGSADSAPVQGEEGEAELLLGALERPWRGHPDGAAVICGQGPDGPRLCIVECDVAASAA